MRTIVSTGDSSNRIDMIFLGDGYTNSEISSVYTEDIQDYLDYCFDDSSLTQPFGRYENFFNVYAVDVVSNQSGADDPGAGVVRDTALDASYKFDGVTQRLLYVNETKTTTVMNAALSGTGVGAEMRYVLVNDTQYGGGGGYFGVYAAGNSNARDVALHEIGHSFADLADEYGGNTGTYAGGEPGEINVTKNSTGAKWSEWLGYSDPVLGVVGAYEGGRYYDHGIYRPTDNSKMRGLDRPFDPIAREEFIHKFYELVDPIDSYDSNVGTQFDIYSLSVEVIDPEVICVDWTVDGQTFSDIGEVFNFNDYGILQGSYTVTCRAYDPTDWVRGDRSDLEQTVTWTVVTAPNQQPTAVTLVNVVASIVENASTASPVKIADIEVADADGGQNELALTGVDAAFFEIVGTGLFLKAGTLLDFETRPSYAVAVQVDDKSVGATPDAVSATHTLSVVDANDAAPVITSNGGGEQEDLSITENASVVTTVTATDADGGVLEYSIAAGLDGALFSLDPASHQLVFKHEPDFEKPGDSNGDDIYDVTVQVSDGVNTDTQILHVSVTNVAGVVIKGTRGNDTVDGSSPVGSRPTSEEDKIDGRKGNDKLFALGGNDLILGGKGNDKAYGGDGDDLISGGKGKDKLVGDAGADGFLFDVKLNQPPDKVKDFDRADGDYIQLDSDVFSELSPGAVSEEQFDDLFDYINGKLYYKNDHFATLSGNPVLEAVDLLVT